MVNVSFTFRVPPQYIVGIILEKTACGNMDFIFDFLVYGIFEFLGENFVSLFTTFIPSRKLSTKDYRILYITGLVVSLLLFTGLIYGVILLVESNAQSFLGWVFITLAVVYIISGIVFKLINKKYSR